MLGHEKLTISRKVTEYEARISSQTLEINSLKGEVSRAQSVIQSYQSNKANTTSAHEAMLKAEVEGLKKENENFKREILQRNASIESERRSTDRLRSELQSLKDQFTENERKALSEHTSAMQNQANLFQDQIQSYQAEIKRLNEQVITIQNSTLPHNEQIISLNRQIHDLGEQLSTAQSLQRITADQLSHEKDQNKTLAEQVKNLKESLSAAMLNYESNENQVGHFKDQIKSLKEQLKSSQEETQTANSSMKRLQEQMESLRDQLQKNEAAVSQKNESTMNSSSKTFIERNFVTQVEHPTYNPHLHAVNTAYIQETEAELARLRNHIMRLQNELSMHQTVTPGEISEYQSRIHKLRLDLEQAQDLALQEGRKASEYKKALDLAEHESLEHLKQVDHYKSEAQDVRWKLERSEQQIAQLQRDLKAAAEDKERSRFSSEQEIKLRTQVEILTRDLQTKEQKIEKLTMNYTNLSAKFHDLSEVSSKHNTHTRDDESTSLIKEENENLRRINGKLLAELTELRSENNSLRTGRSTYNNHGREYHELNQKLMFLENKFASDKEHEKIASLKSKNRELENRLRQYEQEHEKLGDLYAELRLIRDEISRERTNSKIHEKERDKLETKVSDLEAEVERLREVNAQLESEINQWKIKCELNENQANSDDDMENKNLHYIEEIESLKQLVNEKEDELEMWKNEIRKMEDEINNIYNETENQMTEETEQRLRQYEETVKALAEENENLKASNQDMLSKLDFVDEVINENDILKDLLKKLKEKLIVQLETTSTVCKRASRELELKRKIEEDVKHKIEELRKISDTTMEYSTLSCITEVNNLKIESSKQSTEITDLRQQNSELAAELDIVRQKNKELMEELQMEEEEED